MFALFFCRKTTHTCVTLSANASANDTPHFSRVNVSADGCAHSRQPSDVATRRSSRACSIVTFQLSFAFCCSLTSSSAFCISWITRRAHYCFCSHSTFFVDLCFRHTSGSCSFSQRSSVHQVQYVLPRGVLFLTLKAQDCKYDAAAGTEAVPLFRFDTSFVVSLP